MEKIITLDDGRMFRINTTETLTPEQENDVINQLTTKISGLATGCGTITKGTSKNIKATASGGTGKYYFELWIGATKVADSGTSYIPSSSLPYTFPYTFNTVGIINVTLKAKDDCSGASTSTDNCTVTVTEGTSTVSTIELTGCDAVHAVGGDCTLTAICKDSSGTVITCPTVNWSSSSPSKVSVESSGVNKGLCEFLAEGSSTITASAGGATATKVITVVTTTKKYKCVNNICKEDSTGTFTEPTCNNTCEPSEKKYSCIDNICKEDPSGEFTDSSCNDTCEKPVSQANMGLIVAAGLAIGYLLTRQKKKPQQ